MKNTDDKLYSYIPRDGGGPRRPSVCWNARYHFLIPHSVLWGGKFIMEIIFNAHTLLNLNRGELIQVRVFCFFFFPSSLLMPANILSECLYQRVRCVCQGTMEGTLGCHMVNVSWKEYLKPPETVCSALKCRTLFRDSLWSLRHCNSKLCKEKWMKVDYKF